MDGLALTTFKEVKQLRYKKWAGHAGSNGMKDRPGRRWTEDRNAATPPPIVRLGRTISEGFSAKNQEKS